MVGEAGVRRPDRKGNLEGSNPSSYPTTPPSRASAASPSVPPAGRAATYPPVGYVGFDYVKWGPCAGCGLPEAHVHTDNCELALSRRAATEHFVCMQCGAYPHHDFWWDCPLSNRGPAIRPDCTWRNGLSGEEVS